MGKIIFLPVSTNQKKVEIICQQAQKHFYQGDRLLILAPTDQAAHYLDELLWKYPEGSFLPHSISKIPCKEKIVITTVVDNLNNANISINLHLEPCAIAQQFQILYELYDETHQDKLEKSKRRRQQYMSLGLRLE